MISSRISIRILALAAALVIIPSTASPARRFRAIARTPGFDRVFMVILENTRADVAMRQPFLAQLARQGAYLSNYYAVAHPSQPNYMALVAGSTLGVTNDSTVSSNAPNLADLLEQKGRSWKAYAEGYPGGCFLGSSLSTPGGQYVRRHVPLLNFTQIQKDPARCARVVNATQFDADLASGDLPSFALYVPDNDDNGHDTSAATADRWLQSRFGSLLTDSRFMAGTLFIVIFDEDDQTGDNRVYAVLYGHGVRSGATSKARYDHYSLLRTIEDRLGVGTLGQKDLAASAISDVWVSR